MTVLNKVTKHIIIAGSFYSFPITHIWSDLTVIENLTHNGLHIDYNVVEAEILTLLEIEFNGIRMRKGCIVGLTVKPHVIVVLLFVSCTRKQGQGCRQGYQNSLHVVIYN